MTSISDLSARLMGRLSYKTKFAVICLVGGLPLAAITLATTQYLWAEAQMAQTELSAAKTLPALNKATQLLQQHRGLSAAGLNGSPDAQAKLQQKTLEVSAAMAKVGELPESYTNLPSVKNLLSGWDSLKANGPMLSAKENLDAHTKLVGMLHLVMADVADAGQLSLDSDLGTYYLQDALVTKMPVVLESLGQARARGTSILLKKAMTLEQRAALMLTANTLQATLAAQEIAVGKFAKTRNDSTLLETNARLGDEAKAILALINAEIMTERYDLDSQAYWDKTSQLINKGYDILFDKVSPTLEQTLATRSADMKHKLYFAGVVMAGSFLLVSWLMLGMYLSITRNVASLQRGAKLVADGQLSHTFEVHGTDELAQVGAAFNSTMTNLRDLVGRLQNGITHLSSASHGLAQSSTQLVTSAHSQRTAAVAMASSIDELTDGVEHIAENANQANTLANTSSSNALSGRAAVADVVIDIRDIENTISEAAHTVSALGNQAAAISSIVSVIHDIADQTNLLALNAAIEAARAGEQGRGFAVVADEVRKLAEKTSHATAEIRTTVAGIQTGTNAAVSDMNTGVAKVSQGAEKANSAGQQMQTIEADSKEVSRVILGISEALAAQTTRSRSVAAGIEEMARGAETNSQAAKHGADTARSLEALAEDLQQAANWFKL